MSAESKTAEVVSESEQLLDGLIEGYRRFVAHDRNIGVEGDESALGGVGMALEALGLDRQPAELMMLVLLAVRRLAKGGTDG